MLEQRLEMVPLVERKLPTEATHENIRREAFSTSSLNPRSELLLLPDIKTKLKDIPDSFPDTGIFTGVYNDAREKRFLNSVVLNSEKDD